MMGHCTMPRAFGIRKWLEARFDSYYELHDLGYTKEVKTRFKLDCELAGSILFEGYPTLALFHFIFTRLLGKGHYGKNDNKL